jgi:hypothetical protein
MQPHPGRPKVPPYSRSGEYPKLTERQAIWRLDKVDPALGQRLFGFVEVRLLHSKANAVRRD